MKRYIYTVEATLYISFSLSLFHSSFSVHIFFFSHYRCFFLILFLSLFLYLSLSFSLFPCTRVILPQCKLVSGAPRNECLGFLFLLFGPQPYTFVSFIYLFTFIFSSFHSPPPYTYNQHCRITVRAILPRRIAITTTIANTVITIGGPSPPA